MVTLAILIWLTVSCNLVVPGWLWTLWGVSIWIKIIAMIYKELK